MQELPQPDDYCGVRTFLCQVPAGGAGVGHQGGPRVGQAFQGRPQRPGHHDAERSHGHAERAEAGLHQGRQQIGQPQRRQRCQGQRRRWLAAEVGLVRARRREGQGRPSDG
eukprot:2955654-Pyramimonas_sp.AAC.2